MENDTEENGYIPKADDIEYKRISDNPYINAKKSVQNNSLIRKEDWKEKLLREEKVHLN